MRGWWQDLTDLVLPAECGGCGRPRTVLCQQCRAALSGAVTRRVRPAPEPAGLPVVHAAARYGDEVRAVLLAHKERGALALAAPLGVALAGAVRAGAAWADEPVVLVPVPSARRAVRARGHDPARRIALAATRELRRGGASARVAAVLRQRRDVADQAALNSRQRLENLAGALTVLPGGGRLLAGGSVVLVDDLMTTGASLAEAARAVRAELAERTAGAVSEAMSEAEAGMTVGEARPRGPGPGGQAGRGIGHAVDVGDPGACRANDGAGEYQGPIASVYRAGTRESREERMPRVTREEAERVPGRRRTAGGGAARDVLRAAVVAAAPDAFEINRN
ncbi:ComF family protein [Streptomyces sp. NPDC005263]|uniref:ComF family protein n=1 Tax=Streptomyces sp. NPDC005263 TaxID=3364711 RepID=UPI003688CA2F